MAIRPAVAAMAADSAQAARDRWSEDQPDGVEGTEPAPVIHVTIGRVEVRASVAPAHGTTDQRSRQEDPKVMPLEEYLSRRARGGRR